MSNPHLQKHTLNLRKGDWDFIEAMYAARGISTSQVVRALISNFVDQRKNEAEEETPKLDIDL